jgi:hypothetical protein
VSSGGMGLHRPGETNRPWVALAATLVLMAGWAAWSAGFDGPYLFDDVVTPLTDPASQSLEAWVEFLPQTLRPVTKLTYAVEAEAGLTGDPAQRKLYSLLFLVLAAGLLCLLIARLEPRVAPMGAIVLAAVWFLHPVQADNVLLLSGRTALVSAVFLLAALLALDRERRWLAALLFVLACFSRETALAGLLPLAVVAASRPGASVRTTMRQVLPSLAGSALVLLWIITTPRYLQLAEFSLLGRPFWQSLVSQVGAVPVGLELLVRPSQLSIDYGIPLPTKASDPLFLLGLGLYASAAIAMVFLVRRSRIAAIGLALWLAALLPTQSFIPKLDPLTNRPLSLALAGLLLVAAPMLATGLAAGLDGLRAVTVKAFYARAYMQQTALNLAAGLCAFALLASMQMATTQRASLFQSELHLWKDAATKSSTNPRPHQRYARLLHQAGRNQEAFEAMKVAESINPFSSQIVAMKKTYRPKETLP